MQPNRKSMNETQYISDFLAPRDAWDKLSIEEQAAMMKTAVSEGILDLNTIRQKYNEFAEGGNIYSGEEEETQQMEVSRSPHTDLAISNPWLYQKLHPTPKKEEPYEPSTFAGRVVQLKGVSELGQKYADYTSSVIQQLPVVGTAISAVDLGYDMNRLYHNPSLTTTKDVVLDAASLIPALRKTMKGWWMKGNSGQFVTETGQIINNPRVASSLEVILQPFRKAINSGVYGARAADFLDDAGAYIKDMYNSSKIGKHFPIKALGGPLVEAATNEYRNGGNIHIKPSHRGRLTELKKRTGKTEAELYNDGNPAHKKMVVFARSARKWKHGLGGNLFDGTTEDSQKMQVGLRVTNDWKPFTLGDVLANAARIEQQKQAMEDRLNNVFTLSNDATSIANGRPQNRHLERKAVEGAKAHRAWEEEHPVATFAGNVLGAAPLAIAAIPAAGAAIESAPAVASSLAPGSAFWTNPAVQQTAASMLGGKVVDLATAMLTPYDSWGKGVSDVVNQTTGWNPNDSWWGSMIAGMTNPGYLLPYNTVATNTVKASNYMGDKFNEAKDFVKDVTFQVKPERMDVINKAFRNEEWSNFLSTRNGDNYYRLVDKSRESYAPKEKYFISHTTPWEEFSGLGTRETIGTDRLYEFPTKTFGTLRSSTSRGLPTEFDVTEMGRQHLLYGNTSSGFRGPVRVLSDKNAAILGESPFKIGIVDRPTLESGLYENMPIYEQLGMGNQTVLKGSTLKRAINDATYNMFERTPFGITKTIHLGK